MVSGHSADMTAVRRIEETPAADFSALYESQVDGVWRLLQRLGVPVGALDDATQDVFIIVHRRLHSFRGDCELSTWIGGIAVRVAKDHRRSAVRKGTHEPLSLELPAADKPDDRAGHRETLGLVLSLLDQLEDGQREVFVFAELQGMTAPEIAQATGLNVNTVYTRLRAARIRFDGLVARVDGGLCV